MRSGIGNTASDPIFVSNVAGGSTGPQPSASSQSITPASDAATNPFPVVGNVATGSTDTGAPVKIGGKALSTPNVVSNGQRIDQYYTITGMAGSSIGGQVAGSDGVGNTLIYPNNPSAGLGNPFATAGLVFNGTSWDRQRGDTVGTYAVVTPTTSANNALTRVVTATVQSSLIVKASAGNLYGYNIVSGASAGYLMIFDATTAPADGTVTPKLCLPIAANSGIQTDRDVPIRFTTGIVMVFSTTGPFTKTASATAFLAGDAV